MPPSADVPPVCRIGLTGVQLTASEQGRLMFRGRGVGTALIGGGEGLGRGRRAPEFAGHLAPVFALLTQDVSVLDVVVVDEH